MIFRNKFLLLFYTVFTLITFSNVSVYAQCPDFLSLETQTKNTCFGQTDGRISVKVSGGEAGSYDVSNFSLWIRVGFAYTQLTPTTQVVNGDSVIFSGLSPNESIVPGSDYVVRFSDPDCSGGFVWEIYTTDLFENTQIFGNGSANSVCTGNDGEILVNPTGGTPPYSLIWSGPTSIPDDEFNPTGLDEGDYTLNLTDAIGCTFDTTFTIGPAPSANLALTGLGTICLGETSTLEVNVTGGTPPFTVVLDTAGGTWTINNYNNLDPINIQPGGSKSYQLISVTDNNGCLANPITGNPSIVVDPPPTANAGSDEEICEGSTFDLSTSGTLPSVTNQSSIQWTSSGDGAFNDATILTPVYTPGVNDIANGSVTLQLEAGGNGNCTPVTDDMILSITAVPTVDAGSDEEVCEGSAFDLSTSATPPSATNFSSLQWTTSGDGTFDDAIALHPVYTPGTNDISNGTISLQLEAFGNGSCASATDNMTLTITPPPTANAGSDEETCEGISFNLSTSATAPSASDFSSLQWTTSGDGTFDDATSLQPVYTPGTNDITNGSVTLQLQANGNGNCIPVTDDMVLSITPAPVADAGSDEEICVGSTFDLSTSTTIPTATNSGGILWTTTGDGTFNDATALLPVYTPGTTDNANGTVTLQIEVFGNGSCPSVTDNMVLTITPPPTVDAGSDEEVCEGSTFDLSASVSIPVATNFSSLQWTSGGDGTFDNATVLQPVYTPGPNDMTNGSVTLQLQANGNGTCPFVTDDMLLTITPGPVADAGSDEEICEGSTFDLSTSVSLPNASNSSSLQWTTSGDGSFDDATTIQPVYTPGSNDIATGSVTLQLEVFGNGSCPSVTDDMVLTITPGAIANAGSDEEICEGSTFDLSTSGTLPGATNFSSLLWTTSGDGSFDDATALQPVYTPGGADIANGSITLQFEAIGNASCPSATDDMVLTITPGPTVDAGSDGEVCEGNAYDLSTSITQPNSANAGSLTWSTSGDGTFDDATALLPIYTPGANDITNGSVTLQLQANGNGTCSPVTDDMILTITPLPVVTAGSDEDVCEGSSFDLSLSATLPSVANFSSVQWTSNGDGTFDDSSLLHPVYTPGTTDIANGNVSLVLEAFGNGSCASVIDAMVLSIVAPPTANAGSDEEVCEGDAFDLSTSTTVPSSSNFVSLQWTTSGDGTFNNSAALLPVYTPGANDISNGSVTLQLQANGGANCSPVNDDMVLTITPAPVADAGSDEAVCEGSPFDLSTSTTSASASNFSSLLWTTSGDGTFNDPSLLQPTYTPGSADQLSGSVTLQIEAIGNASCASVADQMTLTITPAPIVNAGSDEEICEGSVLDLSASTILPTVANYGSFVWSTSGDGSFDFVDTLLAVYTPGANDIVNGNVTLQLQANGNGNCSPATDDMILTITPAPVANDLTVINGNSPTFCEESGGQIFNVDLTINNSNVNLNVGANTYTWFDSGMNPVLDPTSVPAVSDGETFFVEVNDGTCTSTATVEYTINANPTSPTITGNSNPSCGATGEIYSVTLNPGSTYDWTVPTGATIISGQGTEEITVDFADFNGFITVTETDANGCTSTAGTFQVTLSGCALRASFVADQTTVCVGEDILFTDLSTGSITNWVWNFGDGDIRSTTIPGNQTKSYSSAGFYTVTLTVSDGVVNDDTVIVDYINVIDPPTATFASPDVTICEGSSTDLEIVFTGTGPWEFVINDGTTSSTLLSNTANYTLPVNPSTSTIYTITSVTGAGTCTGSIGGSPVNVTVEPSPNSTLRVETTAPAAPLSQVVVPVTMAMTDDIRSMAMTVTWDFNQLAFAGINNIYLENADAANFNTSQTAIGNLGFIWNTFSLNDTTIANDQVLFEILFDVSNVACTDLAVSIDETPWALIPLNITNSTGCDATVNVINGTVPTIIGPPAPALDTVDVCQDDVAPVITMNPTNGGATIEWFSDRNATTSIGSGQNLDLGSVPGFSTSVVGSTTFYANQTVGGCGTSATDSVTVIVQPLPPSGTISASASNICFGTNVDFTALPAGQPAYQFFKNGVLVQDSPSNVYSDATLTSSDSISVALISDFGCATNVDGTKVTVDQILVDAKSTTDPTLCGSADGSITLDNIIGGTGSYSFSWTADMGGVISGNPTDMNQSNLVAGRYVVEITDLGNGCVSSGDTTIITNPVPFTITINSVTNVSSNGGSDGAIDASVSPGGSYTYEWKNSSGTVIGSSEDLINIPADTYRLLVDDGTCLDSIFATVTQPAPPGLDITSVKVDAGCSRDEGQIRVFVTGGSGNYSYTWSSTDPGFVSIDSDTLSNLKAGTYLVTVDDPTSGIFGEQHLVIINEPAQFNIELVAATETTTCTTDDGQIVLNVTGGSGSGFTYQWRELTGNSIIAGENNNTIQNLAPGFYRGYATDAGSGCTDSLDVEIVRPAICGQLCSNFIVSSSINNTTCLDAATGTNTIMVIAGGSGAGNYQVSMDGGTNFTPFIGTNVTVIGNLTQGSHEFVVRDIVTGCEVITTAQVGVQDNIIVNAGPDKIDCAPEFLLEGVEPGFGATGMWVSNTDPTVSFSDVNSPNTTVSGVVENTVYEFEWIVTGPSGCQGSDLVTITTDDPANCASSGCTAFTVTAGEFENATCAVPGDGKARLTVTGASGPFEYTVDGATWYPFVSGGQKIENLPPSGAPYNITVRQQADPTCTSDVQVIIGGPQAFSGGNISTVQPANCSTADGQVQVGNISGGVSPYTYELDGIVVNMPADRILTDLLGGDHLLMVIDENNCTYELPFNVPFDGGVVANVSVIPATCQTVNTSVKSGISVQVNLDATNIPGPYEASIVGLGGTPFDSTFTLLSTPPKRIVFGLNNGLYNVNVKSVNGGCEYNADVVVNSEVSSVDFEIIDGDSTVNCVGETSYITLGNVVGVQDLPFLVELFRTNGDLAQSHTVDYRQFEGSGYTISNIDEGDYYIRMSQQQSICPDAIFAESNVFRITSPPQALDFDILETTQALVDLNTGSILGEVVESGGEPYFGKIELIDEFTPPLSLTEKDLFNQKNDWMEIRKNEANRYRVTFDSLYSGIYTIYIQDSYGCILELTDVEVPYDESVFVPNIITPNDDGYNDAFYVRNLPSEGTELLITNRNGTKIYHSDNYTIDELWNGGEEPDGIYYYYFRFPDGEERTGWVEIWRGTRP